ncbi:MAG TPA: tetratricopeptide repeat protein, partial [Candidatus Polarisedimenticolia bacterium]|nr:tetratricopeptide repeat protein [Candidatus Polarisedimenticolia bacterium]
SSLDWMELRAIKGGLRGDDAASRQWVEDLFTREMDAARALETAGDLASAHVAFQAIGRDFDGLRDVSAALAKTAELGKNAVVRKAAQQDRRRAAAQRAYESKFVTFLSSFAAESPPPSLEESLKRLGIQALLKRAGSTEDPEDALAARRLLEMVVAHASFYVPRDLLERKDPGRALGMLKIAAVIEPDRPGVLFGMARARAQLGQTKDALQLLARLAEMGVVDAATLAADPYLGPLRNEEGFKQILERLGKERQAE